MPEITYIANVMDAIVLPAFGIIAMLLAKFSWGEAARHAERHFFVALVVMTIFTIRTVISCDEVWLIHTATLASMILGALVIPSQRPAVAV